MAAALCGVLAAVPAGAQQRPSATAGSSSKEKVERAVRLHDEARALYEKGEYRKAVAKLEEALILDPQGKELVYNLALIHERLLEFHVAEQYYRAYIAMEEDPKLRERTQRTLDRIAGAKKAVAGAPATGAPTDASSEGESPPAEALPASGARGAAAPMSPWVYVTGGVAAGGLLVGTGLAISALSRSPGDEAQTGGGVTIADLEAEASTAHTHAVFADVSFAIAAAAGVATVVLYVWGRGRAQGPQPAAVSEAFAGRVRF